MIRIIRIVQRFTTDRSRLTQQIQSSNYLDEISPLRAEVLFDKFAEGSCQAFPVNRKSRQSRHYVLDNGLEELGRPPSKNTRQVLIMMDLMKNPHINNDTWSIIQEAMISTNKKV